MMISAQYFDNCAIWAYFSKAHLQLILKPRKFYILLCMSLLILYAELDSLHELLFHFFSPVCCTILYRTTKSMTITTKTENKNLFYQKSSKYADNFSRTCSIFVDKCVKCLSFCFLSSLELEKNAREKLFSISRVLSGGVRVTWGNPGQLL